MTYPRLAGRLRDIVGKPAFYQPDYDLTAITKNYQMPPSAVTEALERAVPYLGGRLSVKDLSDRGALGLATPDGDIYLSPKINKGKASIIAHELGHWMMKHDDNLPIWQREVEAESISHDVLNRLVPDLSDQFTERSAGYLAKQIWNPYKVDPVDYLLERHPVLQRISDRIVDAANR